MEPAIPPHEPDEPVTKSPDVVVVGPPDVVPTSPPPSPPRSSPPIVPPKPSSKSLAVNGVPKAQNAQQPAMVHHVPPRIVATAPVVKPNSHQRKMSTMIEEDSSDDLDNDCPNR